MQFIVLRFIYFIIQEQNLVQNQMKTTLEYFFPKSIDYVMQDPLLFGDYRNAMQPDQKREYEDLLDYEAVYHLFTEVCTVT